MIKNCKGIILLSAVEAGFTLSGNIGTGVIMLHKYDETWSPPLALGLGGVRSDLMVGAKVKDIVICVIDDTTLAALSGTLVKMEWTMEITPSLMLSDCLQLYNS